MRALPVDMPDEGVEGKIIEWNGAKAAAFRAQVGQVSLRSAIRPRMGMRRELEQR